MQKWRGHDMSRKANYNVDVKANGRSNNSIHISQGGVYQLNLSNKILQWVFQLIGNLCSTCTCRIRTTDSKCICWMYVTKLTLVAIPSSGSPTTEGIGNGCSSIGTDYATSFEVERDCIIRYCSIISTKISTFEGFTLVPRLLGVSKKPCSFFLSC